MLHYAVVFLVIALVAAVFGFGGNAVGGAKRQAAVLKRLAAGAVGIAKVLFFVFVIMAVVSFIIGLLKKN